MSIEDACSGCHDAPYTDLKQKEYVEKKNATINALRSKLAAAQRVVEAAKAVLACGLCCRAQTFSSCPHWIEYERALDDYQNGGTR